jgi:hypothetical protein
MLLHALHRKLRSCWTLWKEGELIGDVIRDAETSGPVAIENNALKNRIDILNTLIEKEGIDPKYVDEFIMENESYKEAMLRKSVHRLRYNASMTNFQVDTESIVPRAFLSWKLWILRKRKVFRAAVRCWGRLRRPDLVQAFQTWKSGLPLVSKTVGKLTR